MTMDAKRLFCLNEKRAGTPWVEPLLNIPPLGGDRKSGVAEPRGVKMSREREVSVSGT